jgi:DNA-binding transcriptional ArsR family regulator
MYNESTLSAQNRNRDKKLMRHLAEAMGDPLRGRILAGVAEKPGITIREVADWLGEPNRKVRYHVEALHDQGVIEVQSEGRRRGAIERQYRMTTDLYLNVEDGASLPAALSRRISIQILKMVMADATESLAAGQFATDDAHCVMRVRGSVDTEGWSALSDLIIRACDEAQEIVQQSRRRLEASGEEGFEVTSGLMLFEAPIWNRS